jgi:ketosteroid isomerase-like protein
MKIYQCVVVVALMFLTAVSPCFAEDAGAKLTGEVTALLKQHDAAFSAQDIKGVMQTFVAGPEIFVMGTGPGEIYRGKEGVEAAYNQFFTKFDKGAVNFSYTWVSAGSKDNMAWFAAEGVIKGKAKGEMKEMGFNLSGTLAKEKNKWSFVAMHFSRLGVMAEPTEAPKK